MTSPSQPSRRRTVSPPPPGRGRTVGVVVGVFLGVAVLVGVVLGVGRDRPVPVVVVDPTPSPVPVVALPVPPPVVAPPAPPPSEASPSPSLSPLPPPPVVVTARPVPSARRGAKVEVQGPARVQWLVGGRVARTGTGSVEVPPGVRSLQARDPRRGVTSTVRIVDDAADYEALPRVPLLLRARPWARVSLGDEELGQTPLQPVEVVPGRYVVRFVRPDKVVTRTVDVAAGAGTVKVNVDMEQDGGD